MKTPRAISSAARSSWGRGGSPTRSSASGSAHAAGARGFEVDFGWARRCSTSVRKPTQSSSSSAPPSCEPRHPGVRHNLGKAHYAMGLVDEAVDDFRAALAANDDALHRASLATVIPGAPSATHADVLAARRAFAENDLPSPRFQFAPERSPGPLRVGYLSSFFESPNWMKPVWGLVNEHDRTGFAVHLLSDATEEECAAAGYRPDRSRHVRVDQRPRQRARRRANRRRRARSPRRPQRLQRARPPARRRVPPRRRRRRVVQPLRHVGDERVRLPHRGLSRRPRRRGDPLHREDRARLRHVPDLRRRLRRAAGRASPRAA